MFTQQVGRVSPSGWDKLFNRQSKVKTQYGGWKAARAERIGNTNKKYRANPYTTSKTGKKRHLNDLLVENDTISM